MAALLIMVLLLFLRRRNKFNKANPMENDMIESTRRDHVISILASRENPEKGSLGPNSVRRVRPPSQLNETGCKFGFGLFTILGMCVVVVGIGFWTAGASFGNAAMIQQGIIAFSVGIGVVVISLSILASYMIIQRVEEN